MILSSDLILPIVELTILEVGVTSQLGDNKGNQDSESDMSDVSVDLPCLQAAHECHKYTIKTERRHLLSLFILQRKLFLRQKC